MYLHRGGDGGGGEQGGGRSVCARCEGDGEGVLGEGGVWEGGGGGVLGACGAAGGVGLVADRGDACDHGADNEREVGGGKEEEGVGGGMAGGWVGLGGKRWMDGLAEYPVGMVAGFGKGRS